MGQVDLISLGINHLSQIVPAGMQNKKQYVKDIIFQNIN